MVENPQSILDEFVVELRNRLKFEINSYEIKHELWKALHNAKGLPHGYGAVYVFTLVESSKAKASPNRALKVGKAGPNSNARFKYQHYCGSAKSTLAGAIENNPLLWSYIGFPGFTVDIGEWIRNNTDRDNFYIPENRKEIIDFLEVYFKAILGPVFEGSLSSKA
ncbi:MAG: hypothetical protein QXO63_03985 [Thermoplasmatales archaeon]